MLVGKQELLGKTYDGEIQLCRRTRRESTTDMCAFRLLSSRTAPFTTSDQPRSDLYTGKPRRPREAYPTLLPHFEGDLCRQRVLLRHSSTLCAPLEGQHIEVLEGPQRGGVTHARSNWAGGHSLGSRALDARVERHGLRRLSCQGYHGSSAPSLVRFRSFSSAHRRLKLTVNLLQGQPTQPRLLARSSYARLRPGGHHSRRYQSLRRPRDRVRHHHCWQAERSVGRPPHSAHQIRSAASRLGPRPLQHARADRCRGVRRALVRRAGRSSSQSSRYSGRARRL